jgi:hypothetical protein
MKLPRRLLALCAALTGLAAVCGLTPALAQDSVLQAPIRPNAVSVALVQQDSSDCLNSTVKDDPDRTRGGAILVTRNSDGTATIDVGVTVTPDTTYHFYLKCVRLLGDITTDGEGVGLASFRIKISEVRAKFAFAMLPQDAASGNKFQSLTVALP